MTFNTESKKKQILSDPVVVYSTLRTEANEQEVATLAKLRQQHLELKKQYKELKGTTQGISREIGAAKRSGKPADELKSSMQEMSIHLKAIKNQLGATENCILEFFASREEDEQHNHDKVQTEVASRRNATPTDKEEDLSITLLDNELHGWNAYVSNKPDASIYHRAEWRDLIRKTFGHRGAYFIAHDNSRNVVGILPLIRLKSRLFGDFLISMPYFNYGGAIANHGYIRQRLVDTANEHAGNLGVEHVEYRDNLPCEDMPEDTRKSNMLLELPGNDDELWASFPSKLRSQIRRPLREHPVVLCGGAEYLDDFYSVFAHNMRDLGTPVYSKEFFGNILNSFPDESRILLIRLDSKPVAAGFLLGYKGKLEIPWASTLREVNHLSMNMLLYWEVLKFAIQQKYNRFDFGRSSKGSGTYRFKQQWGARPEQSYWHYWLNADQKMPSLNPDNPKYAMAINIWKHLPLVITNRLGPLIVRSLP